MDGFFLPMATGLKSTSQLKRKTLVTERYAGEAEQNSVAQVKDNLLLGAVRLENSPKN